MAIPHFPKRERFLRPAERPVLPRDLAGAVAQAGVNPALDGRALQDALPGAIATRYEKRARNYRAMVILAAIVLWL